MELKLRTIVPRRLSERFGDHAASAIEGALDARERDMLARAAGIGQRYGWSQRCRLSLSGNLPALSSKPMSGRRPAPDFGGDAEAKRRLQTAIEAIIPVRNEIAHVRKVAQKSCSEPVLPAQTFLRC